MTPPTVKDKLQFMQEGGAVQRFHTRPGLVPNTNAHHQHGVAMMVYFLSYPHMPSASLLMAALTHDLAEQVIGDVPSPAKWRVAGLGAQLADAEEAELSYYGLRFTLSAEELRTLKLADALDCALYCYHERTLGNRRVDLVADRILGHIRRTSLDGLLTVQEAEVIGAVNSMWEECSGETVCSKFDCYRET